MRAEAVATSGVGAVPAERLEPIACINCGAVVIESFCARCGQSRHDHSRSLRSYLAILFEHHLMLDSKTARTLFALVFRPGFLTNAYIDGHRMRYGPPVRTYILVSFAFFVALYLSGFALLQFHMNKMAPEQKVVGVKIGNDEPNEPSYFTSIELLRPPRVGQAFPEEAVKNVKIEGDGAEQITRVFDGLKLAFAHPKLLNAALDEWLPRLLFLLLPIAASLLAMLSRRRGLFFVDHLAFALHLQSFTFVLAILAIGVTVAFGELNLLPPALVAIALYTLVAYRKVYRSSWFGTVVKVSLIGLIYSTILSVGLVAIVSYGLWELPG
jgi:hypothetical protein